MELSGKRVAPLLRLDGDVLTAALCAGRSRLRRRSFKPTSGRAGLRAILNFGHTVGHALEAATEYRRFTHGEAISIGMVMEAEISVRFGLFSPAT